MVPGIICPERAGTVGQGPLKPRDGLRGPARRQVRVGEPVPGRQGVGVVRPEDLIGEGSELPPVGHGEAGQVRPVQALPGAQQERVTAPRPQQIASDPLEAGGARPEGLSGPRTGLVIGPCLQQRVGRRLRRPVQHPGRRRRPDRRLDHRVHPGRRRARGAGRHQPHPLQNGQRSPGKLRSGRPPRPLTRQVPACGRGREHLGGNPVAVQKRGQRQQSLRPTGQQTLGLFGRKRPGDPRGRQVAGRRLCHVLPPAGEIVAVVTA